MVVVHYAVEGVTDVPVIERLIRLCGGEPNQRLVARGKAKLDPKIPGILRSSGPQNPWVVLRDLDHDATCAVDFMRSMDYQRVQFAEVRIAVRQIEAWLLADHIGFSEAFAVPMSKLPADPDDCDDAKRAVIDACVHSRRRVIKSDMLPRPGSHRKVGPGYEGSVIAYATSGWDPNRAAERSGSLARAVDRISTLVERCSAS